MRPQVLFVASLLLLLAGAGAQATTFMMVRDEALVDQAALVVEARMLSRGPAAGAGRAPATEYVFTVERVLKGALGDDRVAVRVPGGTRADGMALKIWGAPAFRDDERALLFLAPREDLTYDVLHLALGAFHVVDVEDRPVALRDFTSTHEIKVLPGGVVSSPAEPDRPRDLERFARWIEDRASGRRRAADYLVDLPAGELRRLTGAFSLFEFGGFNMRWFQFDTGGSVSFRAHQSGQDGVAGGGFTQFQAALNAWNNDASTPINYTYGGTTTADSGFDGGNDGVNAILFNDPNEDSSLPGDFSCFSGGVLAVGGPWFDPANRGNFKGKSYIRIAEADIITNSGLGCFFADSSSPGKAAEELFAHELGHTLGLGHSCDENFNTDEPSCGTSFALDDALMRWLVHDDGRGGALKSDDRSGIAQLYAPAGAGVPAAPSNLQATAVSTDQINLAWQDNATNENEFRVEARLSGGTFVDLGGVPANSTSAQVVDLDPATLYDFRVRARNAAGDSAYSNVASATTSGTPVPCVESATSLCLNNGRFRVTATFESGVGSGTAQVVELTPETGYLWFFSPTNVEAVVKVINGCALNNRYWVFAGGLTDVRVVITVTDSQTGAARTYTNPQGTPFQPIQDTGAFATCP